MKSFKKFVEDTTIKALAVGWGRFNPPHIGHEVNFKQIVDLSKKHNADYRIYPTQSEDPKKNPLPFEEKVKFLRKMFPKYARNIILDKKIKTVFDMAKQAYKDGYTKFILGVGPNQVKTFSDLLNKYHKEGGDYYFPNGLEVVDTGKGKRIYSATQMRKAAVDNDLKAFALGVPKGFKEIEQMFNAVRKGMGLKESRYFRKHIDINPNETRERFFNKEIFNIDDKIISIKNNKTYTIKERFSNYVSAVCDNNKVKKFFITDIIPINEKNI